MFVSTNSLWVVFSSIVYKLGVYRLSVDIIKFSDFIGKFVVYFSIDCMIDENNIEVVLISL